MAPSEPITPPRPSSNRPPTDVVSSLAPADRAFLLAAGQFWPGATEMELATPTRLGRFVVERLLGWGGAGVVYLARDTELGRPVALKIPRPQVILDPAARQRFLREARAAAALDHPNVVPLLEVGDDGPLGYLAYVYCPGPTLAAWLTARTAPVPVREAVELVAALADGVHHAHEHGVVHRDLKPGNVLLEGGDVAGGPVRPRITDFGLAKLADDTAHVTHTGQVFGTPAYMAPEQALGRVREVGPATDVWALGAILFECLTGRPPFGGGSAAELVARSAADEPPRPRSLRADVPPAVEAVCRKCLEMRPAERYASAAALADDLRRALAGGAVAAASPFVLSRRLVRRFGQSAGWAAAIALAVTTAWAIGVAGRQLRPDDRLRQARAVADLADYSLAAEFARRPEGAEALADLLRRHGPVADEPFEWRHLRRFSSGPPARTFVTDGVPVVAVSPAGDGQFRAVDEHGRVQNWDAATGRATGWWSLPPNPLLDPRPMFAADGESLVVLYRTAGRCEVRAFAAADGQLRATWPVPVFPGAMDVAPDGRHLVVSGRPGKPDVMNAAAGLIDLTNGRWHSLGRWPDRDAHRVAISRDARTVAIATNHKHIGVTIEVVEAPAGWPRHSLPAPNAAVTGLSFSPDGGALASDTINGEVRVHELVQGRLTAELDGFGVPAASLTYTPDGRTLIRAPWLPSGGPAPLTLIGVAPGRMRHAALLLPRGAHSSLALAADGTAAVGLTDGRAMLWPGLGSEWPLGVRQAAAHAPAETWGLAWLAGGAVLATSGDDHQVRLWDAATLRARATLVGHDSLASCLAADPAGTFLVSGSYDHTAIVWDAATGAKRAVLEGHTSHVRCVAVSPDGSTIASGSRDATVRLWDARTRAIRGVLTGHVGAVEGLSFAPSGRELVSVGDDDSVRVWDSANGRELRVLRRDLPALRVAHAPDGSLLFLAGRGGIHVLRPDSGEDVFRRGDPQDRVLGLAVAPDGRTLAAAGKDQVVRLWRLPDGEPLPPLGLLPAQVNALAFSPNGRSLSAAVHDGTVSLWEATPANAAPAP
jgi:WD40 repeat protein